MTTFRLDCGHTATEALSDREIELARRGGYVFDCESGCRGSREATGVVIEEAVLAVFVSICAQPQRSPYRVTFTGEKAADHFAAFLASRGMTHAFHIDHFASREDLAGAAWEILDPPCEHGLSSSLCAGPGHYPADY